MSDLPEGFVLDTPAPSAGGLPEGFVLDSSEPPPKKPFSLTSALAETWPARVAKSIYSGVTLPGDVAAGQARLPGENVPGSVPFGDPQSSGERVADLTFLANPGMIPRTPGAVRPAAQAAQAAENIGVELPRAIVTDNPLTKLTGQVAARAPGGGPFQEAVKTSIEQTEGAVGRAADIAGGSVDPAVTGGNFRTSTEKFFKPEVQARQEVAYGEVNKLLDPKVLTPLSATEEVVNKIGAKRLAYEDKDPGSAVNMVLNAVYKKGPPGSSTVLSGPGYHIADEVPTREGLTFNGIKDLRTRIGEMLDEGPLPQGVSETELRSVYGSLSKDLEAAVQKGGGDEALVAFKRANALAESINRHKEAVRKVLGDQRRSDEGVTSTILRMASNGGGADLNSLAKVRSSVHPDVWKDVASTAIDKLGKDKAGDWSPARFLSDYGSLSDRGKALLFASTGKRDLVPFLDDIAKVSQKFKDAGKMANTSGSAGHGALYAVGAATVSGLSRGTLMDPAIAIGSIVGVNLMSRVLATKATAASMARWTRAYDAVASSPTPRAISNFNIVSRNLANTINGNIPGAKVDPNDLTKIVQGGQQQQ